MLETKGLCAGYGGADVLHGVTARFLPGRVTGIIGPNGCGKSTLLKTLAGLHKPTAGQVLLDGVSVPDLPPQQSARNIAYLPQSRNVPEITALRMVLHGRFAYLSYPRRYRPQDYEAARRALDWIGAGDLAEKSVSALSGGQRQKVYIAMALAQDTDIVLMDEPTTYLDIRNQMEVMALARRLAELGKAVVMVVHDLGAVLRNADEVLLLHDGRVTACGSPAEVYASGRLQPAFGVAVHAVDTPDGIQYYCTPV
ncbi:MAG TPA: ABC transporter ATP-binding protein [Candidatus Gemmiger faecavium]|nr:ABC transporter ATP-binding protein [Candidatus Gemmiger faecavium]